MATLLERVGALVDANLGYMVTKGMQANSPAIMDQYLRKAEDNLDGLKDAAGTIAGQHWTLRRKQAEFDLEAEKLSQDVDDLLLAGEDDLAAATLARAKAKKRTAEVYRGQVEANKAHLDQLQDARVKLEAKLEVVRAERDELLNLLDLARAKEIDLKAVRSLDGLKGLGDTDFLRVAEGIRTRLDRAEGRLGVEMDSLHNQTEEILGQKRDWSELQVRKARLGLIAARQADQAGPSQTGTVVIG